jgi:hypothetical protein
MRQPERATFDRDAFVERFMKSGGLTYSQARRLYTVMCSVFQDGIVTGSRITIGQVGALVPVWKPPREYNMHFRVKKGRKIERGVHRTFFADGRYAFKFRLYRAFIDSNQLQWLIDMPEPK